MFKEISIPFIAAVNEEMEARIVISLVANSQ